MYLVEVFFTIDIKQNRDNQAAAINILVDQWRYNGQIIGREIPLFAAEQEGLQGFALRVTCPEQHSLLPEWNNDFVNQALAQAEQLGVQLNSLQILAHDWNSEQTYPIEQSPSHWQVLYTTHLQSCSPLQDGETLLPIPLYQRLQKYPALSTDLIKWQENWQACDQLQMNGAVLEQSALNEISNLNSNLSKHGRALAAEIEQASQIPTYYYLYRVGATDSASEEKLRCPSCNEKWLLEKPIADIFQFKCDKCRLVANFSWNLL